METIFMLGRFKLAVIGLAVLIFFDCTAQKKWDSLDPDGLSKSVDSLFAKAELQGFSGTILLMSGDDVLLDKGYGVSDCTNQKTKKGLIYDMGSITKTITAAAILRLVQNQKLSLNTQVSDFIPNWPNDKAEVTILHLLTHTSGIKADFGLDETYISRDSLIAKIKNSKLLFKPGEGEQYSNAGYSLLGYIIEAVSKLEYEAYIKREIFGPLKMKHTGYTLPGVDKRRLACGIQKGEKWGNVVDYFGHDGPSWYLRANGGMLTTTHDLQRFFDALLKSELLPMEQRDLMISALTRKTKGGSVIVRSSGANNIFSSAYCHWLSQNITLVLFTNNSEYPKEKIEPELILLIDNAIGSHK